MCFLEIMRSVRPHAHILRISNSVLRYRLHITMPLCTIVQSGYKVVNLLQNTQNIYPIDPSGGEIWGSFVVFFISRRCVILCYI